MQEDPQYDQLWMGTSCSFKKEEGLRPEDRRQGEGGIDEWVLCSGLRKPWTGSMEEMNNIFFSPSKERQAKSFFDNVIK
jgi:hypothetical protein